MRYDLGVIVARVYLDEAAVLKNLPPAAVEPQSNWIRYLKARKCIGLARLPGIAG